MSTAELLAPGAWPISRRRTAMSAAPVLAVPFGILLTGIAYAAFSQGAYYGGQLAVFEIAVASAVLGALWRRRPAVSRRMYASSISFS